jgi:hypothetical protein
MSNLCHCATERYFSFQNAGHNTDDRLKTARQDRTIGSIGIVPMRILHHVGLGSSNPTSPAKETGAARCPSPLGTWGGGTDD